MRRFRDLLQLWQNRGFTSLSEVEPWLQLEIIRSGADTALSPFMATSVMLEDTIRQLPRELGNEIGLAVGREVLQRSGATQQRVPPVALEWATLAALRDGFPCSGDLHDQLEKHLPITRFFREEAAAWATVAAVTRRDTLRYVHRLAYIGEALDGLEAITARRWGGYRLHEALYLLSTHNRSLLHDFVGASGKMFYRLARTLQCPSLPEEAVPITLAYVEREINLGAKTEGILASLEPSLQKQLRTWVGKTTDKLFNL